MNPSDPDTRLNSKHSADSLSPNVPEGSLSKPKESIPSLQQKKLKTTGPKNIMPLLVIAALILAGGVAAWCIANKDSSHHQKQTDNARTSGSVKEENASKPEIEKGMKLVSFASGFDDESRVELTVPDIWTVNKTSSSTEDRFVFNFLVVGSEKGKFIHIYDVMGVGGLCGDPDTTEYTLIKRIPTKTPGLYFSEYSVKEGDLVGINGMLVAEKYSTEFKNPVHEALNEGETGKDTCRNLPHYSMLTSGTGLSLKDSPNLSYVNDGRIIGSPGFGAGGDDDLGSLGYGDVKDDEEFLKVLQSLKVVDRSQN